MFLLLLAVVHWLNNQCRVRIGWVTEKGQLTGWFTCTKKKKKKCYILFSLWKKKWVNTADQDDQLEILNMVATGLKVYLNFPPFFKSNFPRLTNQYKCQTQQRLLALTYCHPFCLFMKTQNLLTNFPSSLRKISLRPPWSQMFRRQALLKWY